MLRFVAGYALMPVVTLMVFCRDKKPQNRALDKDTHDATEPIGIEVF